MDETVESAGSRAGGEEIPADPGPEQRQMVARFLVGLLLLGGDELLSYLRAAQHEIEAGGGPPGEVLSSGETKLTPITYLALGLLAQSQKRLAGGIRRGMHYSASATGLAFGAIGLLIDNPLTRPFYKPIERRLGNLVQEGERVAGDGRREAQSARLLANRTLGLIANDVLDEITENEEVRDTIQDIVGQQSAQMAGTMMDSTRQFSESADRRMEAAVRRLLRRRPRRELPASPLAGRPLTMYLSSDSAEEGEQRD